MPAPDGFPFDTLGPRSDADGVSGFAGFPAATGGGAPCLPDSGLVPCAMAFRVAVEELSVRRGADPGALAAAVLLLGGAERLAGVEDPGAGDDRLAVRLAPPAGVAPGVAGIVEHATLRRLLALALMQADPGGWRLVADAAVARLEARVETLEYRNKALANALERVSFQPLKEGVTLVRDAAQMFGFANEWCFDEDRVVRRFRELAPVYHPDTGVVACRERMAQLIEARNMLIRHVRTAYSSGAWTRQRRPW